MSNREIVAALWAELASIEPARRCDRRAERLGLGAEATGRARTPAIGRLAVKLGETSETDAFDWDAAASHCRIAFLRGLLLAHGSISVSDAGLHLELVVSASEEGALAAHLHEMGYAAGSRLRRGRGVLTWKEGEAIIGLLRRLGASASTLELETRFVRRQLNGHMNRVVNAESANLRRALVAAHRQLAHIDELEDEGRLGKLSRRTKQVARARRRAPEATFGELASSVGLSRGQVQRAFNEIESAVLHSADQP